MLRHAQVCNDDGDKAVVINDDGDDVNAPFDLRMCTAHAQGFVQARDVQARTVALPSVRACTQQHASRPSVLSVDMVRQLPSAS